MVKYPNEVVERQLFTYFHILSNTNCKLKFLYLYLNEQIYYLGTPYEIYWNDWQDPKGFHIYDTETRELERIVNPYSIYEKIYYISYVHINMECLIKQSSKVYLFHISLVNATYCGNLSIGVGPIVSYTQSPSTSGVCFTGFHPEIIKVFQ